MKLLYLFEAAALVVCITSPAKSENQQWKCVTGKSALDTLERYANLGSALLVLSEEAAEATGKKTAAIVAAATAAYEVAKNNCEGSQASFCKLLFCTQETQINSSNGLGVLAHGQAFQNSMKFEQNLTNSKISNSNFNDPNLLSRNLKPLFPANKGLPAPSSVQNFLPSGNQLSEAQVRELTRSIIGSCTGSMANCLLQQHH